MPDIFTSPTSRSSATKSVELKSQNTGRLNQALSSYLFMPDGIRFETQEPGETIVLFLRKHWITNLPWVLIAAIIIIVPIFLFPAFIISGVNITLVPKNFITLLIFSWYLMVFSYLLVNFLLWYFTVSVVTQERIIDIDFVNLLNKKLAETRIARVEDVTMRTGGFIRSFFDYGDVFVQTAAKDAVFQFDAVPRPAQVVRVINQLMGKEEEEGEIH